MHLIAVSLGGRLTATCVVARTAAQQATGLQEWTSLGPEEGMLFPFEPARAATFHMGRVPFPIDVVFAEPGGRIARVVHNAQPGTRDTWSHHHVGAVVEVQGGMCRSHGIGVGHRLTAQSYNLLRTITEASPSPPSAQPDDGYYGKEPLGVKTPVDDRPPEERFKDRRLPDESFSEAMDQPSDAWDWTQQMGYQPTQLLQDEGIGPNVRRSQLVWSPDPTNHGATESVVVTMDDLATALGHAVRTADLPLLADGLVGMGMADLVRIGDDGTLVLFRGRK